MAYWKAAAAARAVRDEDLREALIDALDRLSDVAVALGDDLYDDIVDSIEGLRAETREAREERDNAEVRLEEVLQSAERIEIEDLRKERDDALALRDDAEAKLAKASPLLEAYSDTLAFARKFVTLAGEAGVKSRHARRKRAIG
jgi:phage shock protein A